MNEVFISGEVVSSASIAHRYTQDKHQRYQLKRNHMNRNDQPVSELFIINAWGKTADWALAHVQPGQQVTVRGYLAVRQENGGSSIEITATQFIIHAPSDPPSTTAGNTIPASY